MDGTAATAPELTIGRVVSVSGSSVICMVEAAEDQNEETVHDYLQMGSLVKMRTAQGIVFGLITALSIPLPRESASDREFKIFELALLGEASHRGGGDQQFRRGISMMPSLGTTIYAATNQDLALVYAPPERANIRIGTLHQDPSLGAHVLTDELINKHFAILGTTGAGKSSATTVILRGLVQQHPNAHIILLDPHNEYGRAFADQAEILSPRNLELPYWILNFEELLQVLFGGRYDVGSAEAEILGELIPMARREYLGDRDADSAITVDTPFPYRLSDLIRRLENEMGRTSDAEDRRPYRRIRARIKALQEDARFAFMFGSFDIRDRMAILLSRLFRVPVNGKPMSIVDLSGVPSEVVSVVVAVVGRLTFDFALWSNRATPILLVCEEAHRYSPSENEPGVDLSRRVLSRIAKEGRKYGVALCVVSQRPTKLSSDLLSQCNTIVALRMSSFEDQEYVRASIVDSLQGLLSVLPALRNGEGIVIGQGVSFPFRLHFRKLEEHERPHSGTADVSEMWMTDTLDQRFLEDVVHRWRYRDAGSAAPVAPGPLEPAYEPADDAREPQMADPYAGRPENDYEDAPGGAVNGLPGRQPYTGQAEADERLSAFRSAGRRGLRRRAEDQEADEQDRLFRQ